MISFQKKFADSVISIDKNLRVVENFFKTTNSIFDNPKLLLRILDILVREEKALISIILKYEYLKKRIFISKDAHKNFKIFFEVCISNYSLSNQEKKELKKIVLLDKIHKDSGFEFIKNGKVILLDDHLKTTEISMKLIQDCSVSLRTLLTSLRQKIAKESN